MDTIDTSETAAMEKNKKLLLDALNNSLGIVSTACTKAGVCRQTYYNYMKDSEFARQVNIIQEKQIDMVESAMLKKILEDRNPYLIRFYLICRARHRGYIERHEQVQIQGMAENDAGIKELLEKLVDDQDLIELEENKGLDPAKRIEHNPD